MPEMLVRCDLEEKDGLTRVRVDELGLQAQKFTCA